MLTEELQPSTASDERHAGEPVAPLADLAQTRVDPVAPTSEQSIAIGPTGPTMGEPSTAGPASPGSGLHDEGDPGAEEMWGVAAMSSGLAGASTEPTGDAPRSVARGPPMVAEQVAAMVEAELGRPVRARQQQRRAPMPVAVVEVE